MDGVGNMIWTVKWFIIGDSTICRYVDCILIDHEHNTGHALFVWINVCDCVHFQWKSRISDGED